ncbi:MAG TPA: hypothetical protein VFE79_01465, partial [Paraburkholderia sp.]|nr:hypothetical protein [Paraburkholderia sp.]
LLTGVTQSQHRFARYSEVCGDTARGVHGEGFIRPISDKTNQTDIPAITSDIFVHKNGPQRWSRPD